MTRMRMLKAGSIVLGVFLLALGLIWAEPAQGSTRVYVTPDGSENAGCGTSWTDPCSLQTALSRAAKGDEIWVAQGLYVPGEPAEVEATFLIPSGVALYGGFVGTESTREQRDWTAHPTILSGDLEGDDANSNGNIAETWEDIRGTNAYHVVTFDPTTEITPETIIDGFTITAGNADGPAVDDRGGGLYCPLILARPDCSPTLINLVISGNSARQGGGLFVQNGAAHMVLTQVTFQGNRATDRGGGLYAQNGSFPVLTDVTFTGNHGDKGGGFYSGSNKSEAGITLTRVDLIDNYAERDGGGAYLYGYQAGHRSTFTDVTFHGNTANNGGGLLDNTSMGGGQPVILTRVKFDDNRASHHGGGMAMITDFGMNTVNTEAIPGPAGFRLTDVTFVRNRADLTGGGMYISEQSGRGVDLQNVIFAGNQAAGGGGLTCTSGCRISVANALFSGNRAHSDGGGLLVYERWGARSEAHLVNVTFSGNHAAVRGGAIASAAHMDSTTQIDLANSIIWGNRAALSPSIGREGDPDSQAVDLSYSLIEDWSNDPERHVWGDRNPAFVASATADAPTTTGNYRLLLGSPAIDAGDNERVPHWITTDLDGNPRFVAVPSIPNNGNGALAIVDMGAYEHPGTADPTPEPTATPPPTASPTEQPSPKPSLTPTVALTPTPRATPMTSPTPESGEGGVQGFRVYLPLVVRLP
jgi:predicted outer membrane repeat protein